MRGTILKALEHNELFLFCLYNQQRSFVFEKNIFSGLYLYRQFL